MNGKLYLVATPIGNLDDMTFRGIETLKNVDYIAAEDTRQTRKLLTHFGIHSPLKSYHEHSNTEREQEILHDLKSGKEVALVSDAGLPAISDPGQSLIALCVQEKIAVIPIPGVNAALSSLIASGLSTETFLFIGFLPREKKLRVHKLLELKDVRHTLIFYEAPHRVNQMLMDLHAIFGERKLVLARELTKKYEEFIRGSISDVLEITEDETIRGELTIVVEGFTGIPEQEQPWWDDLSIQSHVDVWIEKGHSSKESIKIVAEERQLPKREVYAHYHQKK